MSVVYWSMNAKTREYVEPVRSQVSQRLRYVQDRVSDTAKNVGYTTDQIVHEHAWKTLAIVAIGACLVGWFLKAAREED